MNKPTEPLDNCFEGNAGMPYNEWIVTMGNMPEGWWCDGYIIHTLAPAFVCKWDYCSHNELAAFGCGFPINETDCIALALPEAINSRKPNIEKLHEARMEARTVLMQYIDRMLDEEES
jgi:hypothetical protein